MANTDYVLDDTMVGQVIGQPDSYLVNVAMTSPPSPSYVTPNANPATGQFTSGYFTLKATGDLQNLINVAPQSSAGASYIGAVAHWLINGSIKFNGALQIIGVPRGSVWSLTLSDIANSREASAPMSFWEPLRNSELVAR